MEKQLLKNQLYDNHNAFLSYLDTLTEQEFLTSKNKKWTAGQQLEHIVLGVKPVRQILNLPKFILKLLWGQANRESKSYEDLVEKYVLKLENGGRATGRFIPKTVSIEKGRMLKGNLKNELDKLVAKIETLTEEELDNYILPHPLLGKLTLREMIYFTIYHVKHHEQLTKRDLKG